MSVDVVVPSKTHSVDGFENKVCQGALRLNAAPRLDSVFEYFL